jgi:hypothetical protein
MAGSALRLVNRRAVFRGKSHSRYKCKYSHTCDETFHGILGLLIVFGFATV